MSEYLSETNDPALTVETLRVDDEMSVARISLRGLNRKTINHGSTTLYHVLSGEGTMDVDGVVHELYEGVIVEVPPRTPYFDEGIVHMEAVSIPPFNIDDIEVIE